MASPTRVYRVHAQSPNVTARVMATRKMRSSWIVMPPHLYTLWGRYESTGWLAAPYRFATTACRRPRSPIVAMTRTIGAARRNARRTIAWNASDTAPAASTATTIAGSVAQPRSFTSSTNAMYAANVPTAPCAKLTRPEPR